MHHIVLTLGLFAALTSAAWSAPERNVVNVQRSTAALPFSAAIESGDFLYLSGAVGTDPESGALPEEIKAQTKRTLDNLGMVLVAAGLGFEDVVSATVFLSDARYYQQMNEVYGGYFPENPPARATVEGGIVIPGALVEIAMTAARKGVARKVIRPDGWPVPSAPYSWGVQAGDTLFVSGMVGADPMTGVTAKGVGAQVRQTLRNIEGVLQAAGFSKSELVESRVFLSDSRDFEEMNQVYREFVEAPLPVRATVQARLGRPDLAVEVQVKAVKGSRQVVGVPGSAPFSPGVLAGDRLFVSGLVGRGPDGVSRGDIEAQTRQTLLNLKSVVEEAGFGMEQVLEVTVFLTDFRHYASMNKIYREFFPDSPPARATVQAPLMGPDYLVEIMLSAGK